MMALSSVVKQYKPYVLAVWLLSSCKVYALEEDVLARGIDKQALPVTLLDYPAFVALCVDYSRINSWT